MRTLVCIVFLLGCLFGLASISYGESAQEMASICREIPLSEMEGQRIKLKQDFRTGHCWGAFSAVQAALAAVDENNERYFNACSPPESTKVQLISIFLRYTDKHPELLHEGFFSIAIRAAQNAFPCKASMPAKLKQ